ncbi:caspase recruitment domain-containing protein 14 isoform 2-T2 [Rhinophrynus dorsalis]
MDDYRKLLRDIESDSVTSGDSFYVRVNQSMAGRVGGGLQVTCGEILHITDTMFKNRYQWFAHRVNAYTMKDGESGIIPNYPQAQQQLITSIQHMTWQNGISRRPRKQVRIVATDRCSSHLLWTSLDCGICRCEEPPAGSVLRRSCFTLMPYTLVTHYKIMTPRPVLLVPSLLGRILSEKLCASKDFMKCDTECLTDAEYAARYQRGDIIGEKEGESIRCCFTKQNVESVSQQNAHCLLELGLSCLSALIRVGIYPIILHVPLTEKSTKKLKKPLQWWRNCEDLLLECAQREEAELDALPCLYRTVDPDSWSDTESLLCSVKDSIMDEQKRIVWLEKNPC